MSRVKIRLSQVPAVYHNQMFANLVKFRGVEMSKEAIQDNITLSGAFPWLLTVEGHEFWEAISEDRAPGSTTTVSDSGETLEEVVQEAEQRGFANGVGTKYGQIKERSPYTGKIQEHELCSDGAFYYRNIKVRKANGKWIKPLDTVSKIAKTTKIEDSEVAIHAFIKKLVEQIHSN